MKRLIEDYILSLCDNRDFGQNFKEYIKQFIYGIYDTDETDGEETVYYTDRDFEIGHYTFVFNGSVNYDYLKEKGQFEGERSISGYDINDILVHDQEEDKDIFSSKL